MIVQFLAKSGAKHIITLSRSGSTTAPARKLADEMKAAGVSLTIMQGSVVDMASVQSIYQVAQAHPVRGIIFATMQIMVIPRTISSDHLSNEADRIRMHLLPV